MNTLTILAVVALSLVGLLLILNVFIMPVVRKKAQQRNEIRLDETIAAFKKGDKILLASGIRAHFVKRKGSVLYVQIAPGVTIQIDKHAVMGVYK